VKAALTMTAKQSLAWLFIALHFTNCRFLGEAGYGIIFFMFINGLEW